MKREVVKIMITLLMILSDINHSSGLFKTEIYSKSPTQHFREILKLNIGYIPFRNSKKEIFRPFDKGHIESRFDLAYGGYGKYYLDSISDCSSIRFVNPATLKNGSPDWSKSDVYDITEILFKDINTAERVYADYLKRRRPFDVHLQKLIKKENALYLIISHDNKGTHFEEISKLLN
ncbi:MAG: hypothetical protein MUC81_14325 [Bacteroidia bacterium]|jgi:hypothetical protein|nr:hypothetical protein [Bacteroidia bacterium]